MESLLLAQQGIDRLIIFGIIALIYLVSHIIKASRQHQQQAPQKRQRPAPPPRPNRPVEGRLQPIEEKPPVADPQKELEKFLDELGVRKGKPAKSKPTPPQVPQQLKTARQAARDRLPSSTQREEQAKQPTQQPRRDLRSELESRHGEEVHSRLEVEVIAPHLQAQRQESSRRAPVLSGPGMMRQLLRNPKSLSHAYILGVVLGPPHALRQDDNQSSGKPL